MKGRVTYRAGDRFRVIRDHSHGGEIVTVDFGAFEGDPIAGFAMVGFECLKCGGLHCGTFDGPDATLEREP